MPSKWTRFPSKQPAFRRQYMAARRNEVDAMAGRVLARLKHKVGKRAGPFATCAELVGLWHGQRGRCALTGVRISTDNAHLDHVVPRSKGGAHTVDNLRWVHPMANAAKGAHSDEAFHRWLGEVILHRTLM